MSSAIKRLRSELIEITNNSPYGITAGPVDDSNIFEWLSTLIGPKGTPYEDALFNLKIIFPKDYPFHPPKIIFITPIYHCNINKKGEICLDILKDNWSPALTIDKVLLSISSLLAEPNPDDPLCPDISHLYKTNRIQHDLNARNSVKLH
jgi:ubiquitin-conjugating enzyme E2 D/E